MPTNNPSLHYIDAGKLAPTGDHSNCERFWANIKAQHAAIYGPDSAYNFAACNEHGIRMVGRGWDRDSAANGQENGVDYNPGSRALVALMGSDDVPTPQFEQAVADFAEEAYARGMEPPLRPHSSFVATSCPGDALRHVVVEVNAGLPSVASVPEPEPATLIPEDLMQFVHNPNPGRHDEVWCLAGNTRRQIQPSELKRVQTAFYPGGPYKVLDTLPVEEFNSYPVAH